MVFKSSLTVLLVASLAVFSSYTPQAEAHSWLDCVDWRKPASASKRWTLERADENKGYCHGYARRYPKKAKFASLDDADPNRHYQQNPSNLKRAPACSNGRDGEEPGADETRPKRVEEAYARKGYGEMTIVKPGSQLCLRWPAKNHQGDSDGGKVIISIMQDKKMLTNYDQGVLDKVAKDHRFSLNYSNCDKTENKDTRACGGCITLPANKFPVGTYLLQWRWRLNDDEWYTSCADVKIAK